MERKTTRARSALRRPGKFLLRVLVGFKRNQGLLLAGAVAYYTLLSIIPMMALILVGLSHFIEEEQLYSAILTNLKLVIPQHAEMVAGQVWGFSVCSLCCFSAPWPLRCLKTQWPSYSPIGPADFGGIF